MAHSAKPAGRANGASDALKVAPRPMAESAAAMHSGHFGISAASITAPMPAAPRAASRGDIVFVPQAQP
jgi:hypothetical protein